MDVTRLLRITQKLFRHLWVLRESCRINQQSSIFMARSYTSWSRALYAPSAKLNNHGRSLLMETDLEGRTTYYHPIWLRHNCQCPSCLTPSGQKTISLSEIHPTLTLESAHISVLPSQTELPVLSYPGLIEDKKKLWRWLNFLNEYGVCLLTGVGRSHDQVKKLAVTMYDAQATIYGKKFDVKAENDYINIAYSNQELPFHMDLMYYESPPGLQLLHCLRFDDCVEGGESVMLDMFPVVEELREKHPQHFNTLARVPATFQKIHYEREKPVEMMYQCPHIQLDSRNRVLAMAWSPPFEGPLDITYEDIGPYYEAYHCFAEMLESSTLKLTHRLQPGEIMTFNNWRVLHSRRKFKLNGGKRHLKGVYVNIDHFKSTYKVLCKQLRKIDVPVRQVFNRSLL